MTDSTPKPGSDGLVEQLRARAEELDNGGGLYTVNLLIDAASRIEELQGERDEGPTADSARLDWPVEREMLIELAARGICHMENEDPDGKELHASGWEGRWRNTFTLLRATASVDAILPLFSELKGERDHALTMAEQLSASVETGKAEARAAMLGRDAAETALQQAEEKLKDAMGALRPFAEACRNADNDKASDHMSVWESAMAIDVSFGDFRRASSILSRLEGGSGKGNYSAVAGLPSSQEGSDTQDQHSAGKED